MFIGIQYVSVIYSYPHRLHSAVNMCNNRTLCVKDRPEGYTVKHAYGIPFVRRTRIKDQ